MIEERTKWKLQKKEEKRRGEAGELKIETMLTQGLWFIPIPQPLAAKANSHHSEQLAEVWARKSWQLPGWRLSWTWRTATSSSTAIRKRLGASHSHPVCQPSNRPPSYFYDRRSGWAIWRHFLYGVTSCMAYLPACQRFPQRGSSYESKLKDFTVARVKLMLGSWNNTDIISLLVNFVCRKGMS